MVDADPRWSCPVCLGAARPGRLIGILTDAGDDRRRHRAESLITLDMISDLMRVLGCSRHRCSACQGRVKSPTGGHSPRPSREIGWLIWWNSRTDGHSPDERQHALRGRTVARSGGRPPGTELRARPGGNRRCARNL
jgi:hypothetical protein